MDLYYFCKVYIWKNYDIISKAQWSHMRYDIRKGTSMITTDEILNLNYYKKTTYTGWMEGMRFLIRREAPEDGDAIFHAWVWPGPYIFNLTDDDRKFDATFPFTNEGKQQVVDWINSSFEEHKDLWPKRKTDGN